MSFSSSFIVFGSNTDVGKTFFCKNIISFNESVSFVYFKPAETGTITDTQTIQEKKFSNLIRCSSAFKGTLNASPHLEGLGQKNQINFVLEIENECSDAHNLGHSLIVETLGGPASPLPNSRLQHTEYKSLSLPVVLVGDGKLGGINSTLNAFDVLYSRGYDIVAIVFTQGFEFSFQNYEFIKNELEDNILLNKTKILYIPLEDKFAEYKSVFNTIQKQISSLHEDKKENLRSCEDLIWWPFTQHKLVKKEHVLNVERAFGSEFIGKLGNHSNSVNKRYFDASGSWWTQSFGHGQSDISLEIARAASRWGHVLHPKTVVEPVVQLAEELVSIPGLSWANKVFYTDNGSTAVEVALKMAFKLKETRAKQQKKNWKILGLKNSYHGDTLGAMNAVSESVFTKTFAWANETGIFVDFPVLNSPTEWNQNIQARTTSAKQFWQDFFEKQNISEIGAVLIEPLVHGSGGMILVDPLFQKILIQEAQKREIPVIFDEVFSGLFRLGFSSASLIFEEHPDIACYSKILTGGFVPLGVTLAKQEVFECFLGDGIEEALLHGHSYSGYPVGCAAGLASIQKLKYKYPTGVFENELVPAEMLEPLLRLESVSKAWALGSLLVVELKVSEASSGYTSQAGQNFVEKFLALNVHLRPMGNVLYFILPFGVTQKFIARLIQKILQVVSGEI
jgi:bifunctional dethiobiotin synthetase / adenosylmethionine---8-amino-7-oxononanoate aminotransferase